MLLNIYLQDSPIGLLFICSKSITMANDEGFIQFDECTKETIPF